MLDRRPLGEAGPVVGCLGYGAMVLEGYYGPADEEEAVRTLRRAIDLGMMIDSADAFGNGHNEALIARAIRGEDIEATISPLDWLRAGHPAEPVVRLAQQL
jgi:aryl-alcohol dehydrogenase-like predicted oxidoreductase